MTYSRRRIAAILIAGALLVATAIVVRKQAPLRRLAALNAARAAEKAAVEKEMVRLHEAARAAPQDKQKQWDLANFYIKYGIKDKAADQLAIIIHLDHNDLQAQLKLADVSLQVGAYSTAVFYYTSAARRDPMNVTAWQGLAEALTFQRRFFDAMNTSAHALELDGANTKSRLIGASALLNYALQFPSPSSHSDYVETARLQLERLAKAMPDSGEVFYEYGRALAAVQRREEAVVQLERAVKLTPENGDAVRMLADAYEDVNKDDKALKILQDLNVRAPDNPGTNDMLGQLLMKDNKPGSMGVALAYFQKAVAKLPDDQYINERLAEAYEKVNDLPSARKVYEHVTQINPNRPFAFQKLSLIYTRLGESKLADQAAKYAKHLAFNDQQFQTIQEISAKHPEDVGLHLIIADRLLAMKMYAPARDEYLLVLELDPKNKRVPKQFLKEAAGEIKNGQY